MVRSGRGSGPLRVLVVEDDSLVGMGLAAQLQKIGHTVVGQAGDSAAALDRYRAERPDLVTLDIRLKEEDGIALAEQLLKERRCPMMVVSAYGDKALIERAGEAGVYGYLIKPVSDQSLQAQIEVAVRRFAEVEALRAENERLLQDLETRKLMERAKGILMKRSGLTEEEAHRKLQHESQNRRINLAELCRRVIETDELLGGG